MNKADIAKRNMDKITYTNNDINFLLEWRDRNQDLVRMGVCPIKAIKIISIEFRCFDFRMSPLRILQNCKVYR